ncbi:MAG TPA: hypothetical protein P5514_14010 [Bacteroidales bacterium]|nr:hypothetical protein [Bacteroidales bacterium]HRX98058.1 hypothetical protein [Bacteroidales bacterium]
MHIYKFRMIFAEVDDFVRDFEIQANQSFADFHKIIVESVGLDENELSSFHICDQKWNKLKEITLIDMLDGEEPDQDMKPVEETHVMHDSAIRDFINEPRQRLLFEYDFVNLKTFFIELLSVYKKKDETVFPKCTFKRGSLIDLAAEVDIDEGEDEELRKQLIQDFEDMIDGSLDDYVENQ